MRRFIYAASLLALYACHGQDTPAEIKAASLAHDGPVIAQVDHDTHNPFDEDGATVLENNGLDVTGTPREGGAELPIMAGGDDFDAVLGQLRPDGTDDERIRGKYIIRFSDSVDARIERDRDGLLLVRNPEIANALERLGVTKGAGLLDDAGPRISVSTADAFAKVFVFDAASEPESVIKLLEPIEGVEWIEPLYGQRAFATPNDTYYRYQWHMHNLDMATAWDHGEGDGAVVAVIDTGVTARSDGFGNLLQGRDFIDGDNNAADGHGHGTHVAGTVAQATNNSRGVAGMAPNAAILPVRVLNSSGYGTTAGVAAGIVWAAANGANVINLSLGGGSYSAIMEEACNFAQASGVLVVAASGNNGSASQISYPARYASTLAVGALDINNTVTWYSNKGAELDLVAPGGDTRYDRNGDGYADGVLQETYYNGVQGYWFFQGTSMASPHVAGLAAQLYGAGKTSVAAMKDALFSTATDLGASGKDTTYGHGMINPAAALQHGAPPPEPCAADRCLNELGDTDLYVTEVMANPNACSDTYGEWIEIYNATEGTVNIGGLTIEDEAGHSGTIEGELIIESGAYAILGRTDAARFCDSDVSPIAFYGSRPALNNGGDQVFGKAPNGNVLFASNRWSRAISGESIELDPKVSINRESNADDAINWQLGSRPYGIGVSFGTPGSINEAKVQSADLVAGDVIVTEIMANPSFCRDNDGEWIEVYNASDASVDLAGLLVKDDSTRSGTVDRKTVLAPGQFAVLARGNGSSFCYGFTPNAFYGGAPALNNGGDTVRLVNGNGAVDVSATYGTGDAGVSFELLPGAFDGDANDDFANWAPAIAPLGDSGDYGTPGEAPASETEGVGTGLVDSNGPTSRVGG